MALAKLQALHAHIEQANLMPSEQLDSWMEDGTLVPAQQKRGAGLLICKFKYDAIFSLEDYSAAPELLMALVCAWLIEHDAERDDQKLTAPDMDVDMVDEKRANVELKITFQEDIELTPDVTGPITLHGIKYRIADLVSAVADEVGVGNDESAATDLPYKRAD